MKTSLARFREAGSFIAGVLIGLSILAPVFAMMVVDAGASWVFGALIVLALGLALQVVATTKPRHRRTTGRSLKPDLADSWS
jgi:hypothetical protein